MRAIVLLTGVLAAGVGNGPALGQNGAADCEFTQYTFRIYQKGCSEGDSYACAASEKLAPSHAACEMSSGPGTALAPPVAQTTTVTVTGAPEPDPPADPERDATRSTTARGRPAAADVTSAQGGPAARGVTRLSPELQVETRDYVNSAGKYIYELTLRNDGTTLSCCQVTFDYMSYRALRARLGQAAPVRSSSRLCVFPSRTAITTAGRAVIGSVAWRVDGCETR